MKKVFKVLCIITIFTYAITPVSIHAYVVKIDEEENLSTFVLNNDSEYTENPAEKEIFKENQNSNNGNSNIQAYSNEIEIQDVQLSNINSSGYTITCKISAVGGVKKVLFSTWNDVNGQVYKFNDYGDITGNTVTYRVNISNHNNVYGNYTTRIYAYDQSNNKVGTQLTPVEVKNSAPIISNIKILEKNSNGFTIQCDVIDNDLNRVLFSTWNDVNGIQNKKNGYGKIENGKVTFHVNIKDFDNVLGKYTTRIYAYDDHNLTSSIQLSTIEIVNKAPILKKYEILDIDSKGYTIQLDIDDDDLNRVLFSTRNSINGDSKKINSYGIISGNKVTYRVNIKDHQNVLGEYTTRIYIYDDLGQIFSKELPEVKVTNAAPKIDKIEIKNKTSTGYTIECIINDDDLNRVLFSTWNKDDKAIRKVNGYGEIHGNKVTFRVNIDDHYGKDGDYVTRIYAYDDRGQQSSKQLPVENIKNIAPIIKNVQILNKDALGYIIQCEIVDDDKLNRVLFSTWSDDSMGKNKVSAYGNVKGNIVTYRVNVKDFGNFTKNIRTRIYAYDSYGHVTGYEVAAQNVTNNSPVFQRVEIVNKDSLGYTIKCIISDDDVLDRVLFSTWTTKNGNNKKINAYGTINGKTVTYRVNVKDLGNKNNIVTRVYAYDSIGQKTGTQLEPQRVINNAPIISNAVISDVDSKGFTITCDVSDDDGISKVLFPVWTKNEGNNNLVWGEGIVSNGKASYRVNVKNHKYITGAYESKIYAYDNLGQYTILDLPTTYINLFGWQYHDGEKHLYDANGSLVGAGTYIIDVSEHNGYIDWNAVKNSGVDGVILRSSYGWRNDLLQIDKQFQRNVSELNRLGIPYGIYHFSYATSTSEGREEANYVLRCMQAAGARPTLPIYYDLEASDYVGYRNSEFYTQLTMNFANIIHNNGYQVGIYANYNWWTTKLIDNLFNNYTKWIAHYGTDNNNAAATANPYWHADPNVYDIWQYSSYGSINGINGRVDINIKFN